MTLAVVQAVSVAGSNVISVSTPAISTSSGNLVHADLASYNNNSFGTVDGATFSDTAGNTWNAVSAALADGPSNIVQQSRYAKNATGNASNVYTLTLAAGGFGASNGYGSISVVEVSGADTTAPLDLAQRAANGFITTPSLTTSGSTAQANEIAFGGVAEDSQSISCTEASGWTNQTNLFPLNLTRLNVGTKILSSTGTVTYNPTFSSASESVIWIVTYKAASGGGAQNITMALAALILAGFALPANAKTQKPVVQGLLKFAGFALGANGKQMTAIAKANLVLFARTLDLTATGAAAIVLAPLKLAGQPLGANAKSFLSVVQGKLILAAQALGIAGTVLVGIVQGVIGLSARSLGPLGGAVARLLALLGVGR